MWKDMDKKTTELESSIYHILNQSALNEGIKKALGQTFNNLIDHMDQQLEAVAQRVEDEKKSDDTDWNDLWKIVVVLAAENEETALCSRGFYKIPIGASVYFGNKKWDYDEKNGIFSNKPIFLNCDYERLNMFCDKTYTGYVGQHSYSYRLIRHNRFVEAEKLLHRIAGLYGITVPVVFSPYARKAVDICISGDLEQRDWETMDFCWPENGLKDIIVTNCNLLWNVDIGRGTEESSNYAPHDDVIYYEYFYNDGIDDRTFIYPDCGRAAVHAVYKHAGGIRMICPEKLCQTSYDWLMVVPVADREMQNAFRNLFLRHRNPPIRLRTRGDIGYVLSEFTDEVKTFSCQFLHMGRPAEGERIICRYGKDQQYLQDTDMIYYRDMWKRPFCCVRFDGPEVFVTDYANYVLHYLEATYPEFNWVGVR